MSGRVSTPDRNIAYNSDSSRDGLPKKMSSYNVRRRRRPLEDEETDDDNGKGLVLISPFKLGSIDLYLTYLL